MPKYIPASKPPPERDVLVHAGRLIDAVADAPRENASILIRGGLLDSISAGFLDPGDAELIDLSRATVLPGLIDCHVHIAYDLVRHGSLALQLVTRSHFDELLTAVDNARKTLRAGFTSVRDVGGHTGVVVALRKSIAAGETMGPRLWVSGDILCPTGGHADYRNAFDPALSKPTWTDGIVDAPDEAVKAVREHRRAGVDFIKIAASGGVTSPTTDPSSKMMSDAEIAAIVESAHALNMKVAAHAHSKLAVDHCARLGVDSIEHGTFADEASYRIMTQAGTWLVPTLLVHAFQAELVRKNPVVLSVASAAKVLEVGPRASRNLAGALEAGVKIAFGTDSGISPHGMNAREFTLLVAAGMKPMDAIKSATSRAAELLGASHVVGSIQPGRHADLIATDGDPLRDITELERPALVMQGGKVIGS